MTSVANTPSFGDRYQIERELGRGGMATVYLCTDTKFGRPVAIKLLHPDLAAAVGAERFHREIKIATGLTHPNILPAHDSGEFDGSLFYVMPFVEGESLRDRISREKQLPVDETVRIIAEVAGALQYAHTHGIVHRDIKPENILLESGHAVVADFGIARAITSAADVEALTQTGVSIGTPTYMSPEQAVGEKGVDGRSDQYSLACVMYEMLAGQPPFVASTLQGIIMKHVGEPVPLVTTVRPSVPDELEDVLLRALEKVPADRYPTIGDFGAALTSVVMTTGTWTRRTSTKTAQQRVTTRRNLVAVPEPMSRSRQFAIAAAAAALVLSAVLGIWSWRSSTQSSASPDPLAREIAVLYFDDATRDGSLRDVADGLTESLIENLSVPALHVRSRNAVLPFRGSTVSNDSIGSVLGVGTIVRGTVEAASSGGRIFLQLIDVAAGDVLERASFSFDISSAVAAADSLATQLSLLLRRRIGEEVSLRELRNATKSSDAWLSVRRAERLMKDADSLLSAGGREAALLALQQADSLLVLAQAADGSWSTPRASRAAVWFAKAQALRRQPARLAAVVDSGLAHADSALAIDPRNADALEYKGKLLYYFRVSEHLVVEPRELTRALVEAESSLVRAVSINQSQAGAWDALSALYYRKPDLQAVINAADKAYAADAYLRSTRSILQRLFFAHYNLEHFSEAMQWLDVYNSRFPNERYYLDSRLLMYRTKFGTVDVDSAWTYLDQYLKLTPEAERALTRRRVEMYVAGALANAGLADSAHQVLLRARDVPSGADPKRDLAAIEASVRVMLGQHDEAVRLLKEYLSVNPEHRQGFASRTGWWWRDLQSNPRFKALIAINQ